METIDPWGEAKFHRRDMIGTIYEYVEDYYPLPHTKYQSCGPCGFREEDFFFFFFFFFFIQLNVYVNRGVAKFDPWGMNDKIYNADYLTLLNTKYRSSGPSSFREEDFVLVFFPL